MAFQSVSIISRGHGHLIFASNFRSFVHATSLFSNLNRALLVYYPTSLSCVECRGDCAEEASAHVALNDGVVSNPDLSLDFMSVFKGLTDCT